MFLLSDVARQGEVQRAAAHRSRCVRRVEEGGLQQAGDTGEPLPGRAMEEFYLTDGRLVLRRVYCGPAMGDLYQSLAEAGMAQLEAFGQVYFLWFDMVPNYAVCSKAPTTP